MLEINRSSFTIAFLLAGLIGVAAANFVFIPSSYLIAFILLGLFSSILFRRKEIILLCGLVIIGVSIGALRFELDRHEPDQTSLDYYNDLEEKVEITGLVSEEPDRRADHAKYVIEAQEITIDDYTQEISGNVLIKTSKLPEYNYGDELKVRGQIKTPFETDEFSYRDYLARYGIYSVMYYPRVQKISAGHGNPFFAFIFDFKKIFEEKINQVFPEPHASFEAGLLIGSRKGIPEKITEDFNITGLTHIVAISGYNIALVIAFVTGFFGSLVSRKWQFPLAAFFVVIFTFLVGANAAVVRAAIMGLLAFYALTIGRQYHASLAIVLTAWIMVFWNPKILLHDVSFQLSFAAVLGLMFVAPVLESWRWTQKIPNKFAIRESLLMTMSAQVTAVPLIVFYFSRLSLVAPLANILVAPAIPLAMLLGFIAVVIAFVFLPAGLLIGFGAYALLSYILWVAQWGAKLPLASVEVGWFSIGFAVLYYVFLVAFLMWWRNRYLKNKV